MALSISVYNPSGYRSNVNLPDAPVEMIMKVMNYKQNQYDSAYQALQSYKNTALNINFINKERQAEVDLLNKDLESKFAATNGELGDISESRNYNNYVAWFDGFKKNTDLIHAYSVDKKWQEEHSKVQSLKQSKDPTKAGFSAVNEFVFNHKLNSYANSTKDNPVEFKGYTPYTDVVAETTRIYKSLPKKEWTESIPDPQRPGYMKTVKMTGYNQDDLHNVINSMGGSMQEQFQIEAEYNQLKGLNTNPQAYRENLHNSYTALFQERRNYLENKLNQAKQGEALATTSEEKAQFKQSQQQIEQSITELGLNAKTKDWFLTTNEENLLGINTQLHTERKISGLAKGLSNRPSIEYKPDLAYFSTMKLRQSENQFNANLRYKASQDAIQNQFRAIDLQLKAQGQQQDLKYKYDKLKVDSGGKVEGINDQISTGNSGMFSNQSEFSQADNLLVNPDIESYNVIEKNLQSKATNFADGGDYKVPFMGNPQTNDQILEKVITMFDPNNIGKSTAKIKEILNKEGLSNNISLNTIVDALPIMMSEGGNLDIKNKVGFVKTRANQILNGDSQVINGKYKEFATSGSIYRMTKQEEISFLKDKSSYYNQAVIDLPEKDWNKMNETQRNIVSERVKNLFMQNNKLPSTQVVPISYESLGEQPTKDNLALWKDRENAARIVKEKSGVQFDIDPRLISSARKLEDGTTIVQFKGEPDFKKAYGEDWKNVIGTDPWLGGYKSNITEGTGSILKGSFLPNNAVVFKTEPLKNINSVDRVLANGNSYHEVLDLNGTKVNLKLSMTDNFYTIEIDGQPTMQKPRLPGQIPSEVLKTIKREILR